MQSAVDTIVSGRVQMVMYRDYVRRKATILALVGEVENLADGTVRIHAEGEKKNLETFIDLLQKGSFLANVEHVAVLWTKPTGAFKSFIIRYT